MRWRGRLAAGAVIATALAETAGAHRLDEYLQSTLIGIAKDSVDLEMAFTPGVAVLPVVMAAIDRDNDGRISAEEQRAYVDRVVREVELRVDGKSVSLAPIGSEFPSTEEMREGVGTIRMKLRAATPGGAGNRHNLRFENRHLPQISVYLVNCLAAPSERLAVGRQERDEAQRSIHFRYAFGPDAQPDAISYSWQPLFAAIAVALILARIAMLWQPWKKQPADEGAAGKLSEERPRRPAPALRVPTQL